MFNNTHYPFRHSRLLTLRFVNLDINSNRKEIVEDRPSGVDTEHRQPAKTINAKGQKRKRSEKRCKKLALKHNEAEVNCNIGSPAET